MEVENDCRNQENSSSESDKEDDQNKHIPNKETIIIKTEPSKLTANPIVVAFHDKSLISNMQEEKNSGKNVYYTCPDSFKKRERNLIPREKRIFLNICQKHADIHNNSLDTESLNRKRKAWEEIHKQFVAVCPESSDRTVKFLKGCWKRLKKEASASNVSMDGYLNLDAEMALSPAQNTFYILDDGLVSLPSTNTPTHPVSTVAQSDQNSSVSNTSPKINTKTTYLLKVKQPTSTVQASETPKKTLSNEALQRKALEVALEAEKEKLEAHKYLKEAQRYAMMAEKERFETELVKKEAARLALKREKSYF